MNDDSPITGTPATSNTLERAQETTQRLQSRMRAAIRGRDEVIDHVLVALLADGHVLLEDYPGSGKTTLARALGNSIQLGKNIPSVDHEHALAPFRRIQFTPDLLPSDITGTNVFDVSDNRFVFRPGPLFSHIVLADEINRTSPKVQAAMLEAMAEKQVTVDNDTLPLGELFFVIATQNPLDVAGTYPLPTPQLDRFLFKLRMEHIDRESELEVLEQYPTPALKQGEQLPTVTEQELVAARHTMRQGVHIHDAFRSALVDTARALRSDEQVLQGASTRSLVLALPALQARALVQGRDHVTPDDLDQLAVPLFQHRLEIMPGAESVAQVIQRCVAPQLETLTRLTLKA